MFTRREHAKEMNSSMDDHLLATWEHEVVQDLGVDLRPAGRGEGSGKRARRYRLVLPNGDVLAVWVVVKPRLRPALIPILHQEKAVLRDADATHPAVLFVAPQVTAPLAQRLREEGIWFSDLEGNAYLEAPGQLLIYAVGNRSAHRPVTDRGRWMTPQGARVLFQLIARGPRIEGTYRLLADHASVSLGFVHAVMRDLLDAGILSRRHRGEYVIADPGALLDRWAAAFNVKFAARIALGRFHASFGDDLGGWLRAQAPQLASATVGGEAGADLITGYLRPATVHLYVPTAAVAGLRRALKLAPSDDGAILMREAFAREIRGREGEAGLCVARPALVYAELLATDDRRLAETAARIRREHLPWTL
jgi:hypothetical protein